MLLLSSLSSSPPGTGSASAGLAHAGVGDDDLLGRLAALGAEGLDLQGTL